MGDLARKRLDFSRAFSRGGDFLTQGATALVGECRER